ncbi:hypothetical protein Naga_100098g13 [Nannochloropsis gaditana]|uniref:Uncharacterized protein n=1 Tax=Nannochloropsis gaditana TaxID=72520 RepID=W7TNK3_9STRA|nr:hypothetical protein Naga_100098g13 [Nannochloropsis gaditana]
MSDIFRSIFLVDHEQAMSSLHMWNDSVKIIGNPLEMAVRDARLHGVGDSAGRKLMGGIRGRMTHQR